MQKAAMANYQTSRLCDIVDKVKKAGEAGDAHAGASHNGFGIRISVTGNIDENIRVCDVDALKEAIGCELFQMVPLDTQIPSCPRIEAWCDEEGILNGGPLNRTVTELFSGVGAGAGTFYGNIVLVVPGHA